MNEKVTLRVRLPTWQRVLEFRAPWCLRIEELVPLMAQLMRARAQEGERVSPQARLMLLEGPQAGRVLEGNVCVEELMRAGYVVDGSELALI